ncbi:IgG receptor FcRn large subunit p51 isoform X1 [Pongo abelii]|uniref:IgG receptor FcRn large subunit p51 n=3 Tax=Pongo abelii TaxID=9601 RepID=A0A2J8U861_PONAB|nr:IgG receptor FcRn large subunit p51 isoform X1 [Pongo abelii]XP_054394371.1 IgG receptor FcRn large subunit p51 isoform X1 [Pongo abelii]XP_054394372.1 IgG receptor FcRn large subunit p51 isoform X1 [Pongo abelii]PNJ41453.1 FCGRT isoform 2 [Pongo abelii]PNJ41457.1 FCGRT isoform 6 [Pongo abelii]
MGVPRPQPWALGLLLFLLPGSLGAESHLSLLYHLTAVSSPAPGTPAFWVSGWLGPQQYLSYNSLRGEAEPCGAWVWENQVSWYWEKETTDLRIKEKLFLEAFKALGGKGPYTLQGLLGCELGPDNTSVPTAKFALNGEEFMNFDLKQGTWGGDWPEALAVSQRWQQQDKAANKELTFLLFSCPHRLREHLERGRGNLEWKEPPSMRLKARPSSPGFSVLTCSAFSFYPPELQLRFQRNGLAAGTGQGDFGPNSDGSFHASSSLIVKSGDEHHYCCVVQHAGLAQPLRVELESPAETSVLVVGIVIGVLLLMAAAVGGALLWRRMRSGLPAPWISLRGDDTGALLPTPGEAQDADSKDVNVIPATA